MTSVNTISEIIGEPTSLHIDWTVSNICNYDCLYCSSEAKGGDWGWPDLKNVSQTISELRKHYTDRRFCYTLSDISFLYFAALMSAVAWSIFKFGHSSTEIS